MQVHDAELPRAGQLARTGKQLSREDRTRLAWMDFYRRIGGVRATWSAPLADRVLALRPRYPRWGKDKLAVLIRQPKLTV